MRSKSVKIEYMYAVYGLDEDKEKVEVFIGYVPASFFETFTNPELWGVTFLRLLDGREQVGRLCGRAFFVQAASMRAGKDKLREYMGEEPCVDLDKDEVS